MTSIGKSKNKENETNEEEEIIVPPEKRQQIINDLRLFQYHIKWNTKRLQTY